MDSGSLTACWNAPEIKHKVSYLSQKHVCADPVQMFSPIRVCINETKALEVGCGFENRWIVRISNKLSEVKINDG